MAGDAELKQDHRLSPGEDASGFAFPLIGYEPTSGPKRPCTERDGQADARARSAADPGT